MKPILEFLKVGRKIESGIINQKPKT